jgi:magnesium chelatase subunit I
MAPESILMDILRKRISTEFVRTTQPTETAAQLVVHFPFLAIVGQVEMKKALVLTMINPDVGGVLLLGPRGTGKTTAVRGLVDLLPPVRRSRCPYGCEPEEAEIYGPDAICPECAARLSRGEEITGLDQMRLVELPLNARLEDVVGGMSERAAVEQSRVRLQRGILSYAHRNLLYIDEINLLDNVIADAILDAAAQGRVTVRRGAFITAYPAQLALVGSMNPEEGALRPQIKDRFGLRIVVQALREGEERLEVYRRVRAFKQAPHSFRGAWAEETAILAEEIARARERLPRVGVSPEAEKLVLALLERLQVTSQRSEIAALEAARAHAAADGREEANATDVATTAPMALRQRRSGFLREYEKQVEQEDEEIQAAIADATDSLQTK